MRKTILGLLIFSVGLSFSCKSGKSTAGLWMLSFKAGEIPSFFKTISDTAEMNMAGSFINIQSNGDFNARFFSSYMQGEWKYLTDSILLCVSSKHDSLQFEIRHAEPDSLIFTLLTASNIKSTSIFTLGATLNTLNYKEEENPYSRQNNEWALKPDKKQIDIELRKKVLDYIQYLTLVLSDPYNNSDYINQIDNPITLATNGLSLRYVEFVDAWYKQTFYDEADFKAAYRILDGAFRSHLDVMDTDDVAKLDIDLLNQIHKIIKEVRERK